jgi:hypothetical protein
MSRRPIMSLSICTLYGLPIVERPEVGEARKGPPVMFLDKGLQAQKPGKYFGEDEEIV